MCNLDPGHYPDCDAQCPCMKSECDSKARYTLVVVASDLGDGGTEFNLELCNFHTAEWRMKWPEEIKSVRSIRS